MLINQEEKMGVVDEVRIYYYSDQSAETRIILADDDEIWFNAVAPVAEKDKVTAVGKKAKLLATLERSHPKGIVDEAIAEMINQRVLVVKDKEIARSEVNEKLNEDIFRASIVVDKHTAYSIPSEEKLHLTITLGLLTLFYPVLAALGALVLIVYVSSFSVSTIFSAITASFVIVSLISLADQQVLNFLALVARIDWRSAANKSALKDGKAINLALTALFSLIAALIKLKP